MVRNVIFWLAFMVAALAIFSPSAFAATDAATQVAKAIYEQGNSQLFAEQWRESLRSFSVARFLNPDFKEAGEKFSELSRQLQREQEKFYQEGLKAYQSLQWDEAKRNWRMALGLLLQKDNPLRSKIEKALALAEGRVVSVPFGNRAGENGFHENTGAEKMEEVKQFLESGNSAQAILSLQEIVEKESANDRAKEAITRLQTVSEKGSQEVSLSETIKEKFSKSQNFFEEAKQAQQKNDFVLAYQKLKEADVLFSPDDLKPPFFKEMEDLLQETESHLENDLQTKLVVWEKETANGGDLKMIGQKLREANKNYPPSALAETLLQKIYSLLDAKAQPILMQAKTVQQLEGCQVSSGLFVKVKEAALFNEVPAWQEANRNASACKKSVE